MYKMHKMHKKTEICRALMLAFGGSVVLGAVTPSASAQSVTITGSSIRQISSESALPVTVLKAEDLAKAGVTNAEQALAFVTSNQSTINTATGVPSPNGGQSNADLRGLGGARTLVLFNGKRMVANPYDTGDASAVDLNTIPYGAVDRIEVLNDGASAIYGSDAIAGVVNFITRREFQGLELNAALAQPFSSGGGQTYEIGGTAGVGSIAEQGWSVFGSLGYRWQKALPASARSFARTGEIPSRGTQLLSGATFPANYFQNDFNYVNNPTLPDCQPPSSLPTWSGDCGFDYSAFADLIPRQTQLSALARGSYAIDKNNTMSLEYLQGNNTLTGNLAPTGVTVPDMPTSSPFYPGGSGGTPADNDPGFDPTAPIYVPWRTTVAGNRTSTFENKTNRFMLDWVGSHAGWDYTVAVLQSQSNLKNIFNNGYVNNTNMVAGLNGTPDANGLMPPWLNPFGAQTPAGLAYIQGQQIRGVMQRSEGTLRGIKADASAQIYRLPAGALTMATGLEYYRDAVSISNDERITETVGSGVEGALDSFGSRHWLGLFAEFNIPVVKSVELNLALRYDDYSDFGSTVNPKAALRWTPAKELLVRGSFNTGFRAPSLYDVFSSPQLTYTNSSHSDPVLCPGGVVNTAAGGVAGRDCNSFDYQQTLGGSQKLDAESSTAWSAGLVFQPEAALLMSVDYWNYVVDDSIAVIGEDAIFNDGVTYADRIIRCSQLTPAQISRFPLCTAGGTGDPIAYIDNTKTNLGTYKTSGLDFAASWRSQPTRYGRFMFGWQATYVFNYEYQLEAGGVYNNNLGTFFNGHPISRYRQVLNLGWQQDVWTLNLINRYSRGYDDQNNPNTVDPAFYNRVGSVNTWDAALTWSGAKNTVVTAGITNLFDQAPPFSNQGTGPPTGYDYRYANPIGRAFILRAVYRF